MARLSQMLVGGRYELQERLGTGSVGVTHRALDRMTGDGVTVKVLLRDGPAARALLVREFLALRGVLHPHVAEVRDFVVGRIEGKRRPCLVSRFVPGLALDAYAAQQPSSAAREPLISLLSALAYLHARGTIHGDLKPSNVIVGPEGTSTLIDFGCARPAGLHGEIYGTRDYLSPEAMAGEACPEGDLYALGVTFARLAWDGRVSADIEALVARLVAKDRAERPTAVAALDALGARASLLLPTAERASRWVGHESQLREVELLLDRVARGQSGPRLVRVTGPNGVGRSRFLLELRLRFAPSFDVAEGDWREAYPVEALLARALGSEPIEGVRRCLDAVLELAGQAPTLLVVDDADRLGESAFRTLTSVARSLPAQGRLVLAIASDRPLPEESTLTVTLPSWTRAQVVEWLGEPPPAAGLDRLMELSGGLAKSVVALAGERPSALLTPQALDRRRGELDGGRFDAPGERVPSRVLEAISAAGGELPLRVAERLGLERSEIDRLVGAGVVRRENARLLGMGSSKPPAPGALDAEGMHLELARVAEEEGKPGVALAHQVRGGLLEVARERFLARVASPALAAFDLLPAADAFEAHAAHDPALAHAVARVFQEAGEPARALSVVARALRKRPPSADAARLRAIAGAGALRRGDTRRAVRRLRRSFESASGADRAGVAKDFALALLRAGDPAGALDVTLAAAPEDPQTRADLLCSRAVAAAYLGRESEAEEALAEAAKTSDLMPRIGVRLESARALLATRTGRVSEAAAAYGRALVLAEASSLDDLVIQTALNSGTSSHAAGELGAALRAYERGEAMARALGATAAGIILGFNRGKLLGDLGAFEQSEAVLAHTLAAASAEKMGFFEGVCHQALADGRAARGDLEGAERELARAMTTLTAMAAEREVAEGKLLLAEIALARGDGEPARVLLASLEVPTAPDLRARAHRLEAQAFERRGDLAAAVLAIERAARLADESGQALLVAEVSAVRSRMFAARGAAYLAAREAGRAREIWEGVAMGLPAPLDRVFREHPQRRELLLAEPPASASAPGHEREGRASERLRHLVAINRRIGSASTAPEILEATLDAAIELTRAERGFLLLRDGGEVRVAAARNFDQERVTRSRAKFSQAVAKRVLASGEAVVAVDAGSDPRFSGSRSVHALELKSILCVPITGTASVVGALYIDFRFRAGAFSEDDVDVVRAFADQAAIALERAALLSELKAKNLDLESERAELARLAEGRAEEIASLEGRLSRVDKPARAREYEEIKGHGPAMSRVFDLLDRVVLTDLTVLIEGESGTGKELVARAIHRHSARSDKPFLTVNCGALPPALFEGELFGYKKGAFTGAAQDHPGLFVAASGGTLLLDELGELPLDLQVKLLRVLQQREVQPLGSALAVPIDVRILCATHRDLRQEVRDGNFREDLYYRVAIVTVPLPPLRERIEDLPVLARAILERAARTLGRPLATLDRSAERALLRHAFPGNVRELENVLTKALLLADGDVIREADLALEGAPLGLPRRPELRPRGGTPAESARFRTVLEATGWNVCEAARALAMPRATFYRKLRRYGLERPG
jgi:serine/threonine-protein kinase PknK